MGTGTEVYKIMAHNTKIHLIVQLSDLRSDIWKAFNLGIQKTMMQNILWHQY